MPKVKTQYVQFQLLAEILQEAGVSKRSEIRFTEDADPENRFALEIECEDEAISNLIAGFYGCPKDELPFDAVFQASDSWHGQGEGNLRDLADEIIAEYGEFFDVTLPVSKIISLAEN